jgi:predicted nucleotidyltransferase
LAHLKLRDRDAIITREGLILRVFGYTHPKNAYICDAEYAPENLFKSKNPKAFRTDGTQIFHKFYEDEGWKIVKKNFPQYMIFHKPLNRNVLGVKLENIVEIRKPEETLKKILVKKPKDELLKAMENLLNLVTHHSGISAKNFGVFGSLLHGFYHPQYSDIDLIVYGKENIAQVRKTLKDFYQKSDASLRNEFEKNEAIKGKTWRFLNYSPKEFIWHQKRKAIYALFHNKQQQRTIKAEFEPVKAWKDIKNNKEELFGEAVMSRGWAKIIARIVDDRDAPFIPSIYKIEPLEIIEGEKKAREVTRIVSYMEEFRLQAHRDETVYIEGNLEEIKTSKGSIHQITLTYRPRYYEQVLKVYKPLSQHHKI